MTKQHPWYPVFIDVEGQPVLVVGGGSVSVRKVETLLHYGAAVTVVAPKVEAAIEEWVRDGRVTIRRRAYEPGDLQGAMLVIAATDHADVNARVASEARAAGLPVNVVDIPESSSFIVPAVIEEGAIQIAVSTGGRSPALARRLKRDLQSATSGYSALAEILGALRAAAKGTLPTDDDRKAFFEAVIESDALALLRSGNVEAAHDAVRKVCERFGVPPGTPGEPGSTAP